MSKIGRYLDIAYEDALRLVHPFVRMGVLAPPDSAGFRALRTGARATVLLFVMALGGRAAVRRTQPDWQLITSYVELDRIAARCHWLEGEAFLDGPIARFLALAGEPDLPARAGARILEYGRYRAAAFASTLDGGAPAQRIRTGGARFGGATPGLRPSRPVPCRGVCRAGQSQFSRGMNDAGFQRQITSSRRACWDSTGAHGPDHS